MGKTLKQTSFLLNGEILNAFQLRSRVSRVHDSILHCTGEPRQGNYEKKKKNPDWKRNKTISIHR